ncbi:hypothetical protein, partial [Polaromonas sp.]|uniref:hypothetical protein n=1 Tax=Polaromonas sp. TaxID=1869339 RepID=UPI0032657203
MVWVLALRSRQPAVLAENGVELELAALRQSLALIRFRLRSSAQPDGWGRKQTQIRIQIPNSHPESLKR